ncbi:MAG: hypothetical protein R3B40_16815 [Polyangiales bacterium]|nr:hypothetical protein [Sandaracinaceae bacterium]
MLTLVSSTALGGCLALDKVELPEIPDYPPSVLDDPNTAYPSSGVIELDFGGPDPMPENLELLVVLRDPNLRQSLDYRVFVDGAPGEPRLRVSETVESTGELDREVPIRVPMVHLGPPRCHRIELVVSGEFTNGVDQRQPARDNDFATMVWWVHSTDSVTSDVSLSACPIALDPLYFREDPL